jgi:hypothetical protein
MERRPALSFLKRPCPLALMLPTPIIAIPHALAANNISVAAAPHAPSPLQEGGFGED